MSGLADAADLSLLEAFERGTIAPGDFSHRDHVRVAWTYLSQYPTLLTLQRFGDSLKAFAASIGRADLYHETITWAFILLINERMLRHKPQSWGDFAEDNEDLFNQTPPILDRYYTKRTLQSSLAKKTFLMPDRL